MVKSEAKSESQHWQTFRTTKKWLAQARFQCQGGWLRWWPTFGAAQRAVGAGSWLRTIGWASAFALLQKSRKQPHMAQQDLRQYWSKLWLMRWIILKICTSRPNNFAMPLSLRAKWLCRAESKKSFDQNNFAPLHKQQHEKWNIFLENQEALNVKNHPSPAAACSFRSGVTELARSWPWTSIQGNGGSIGIYFAFPCIPHNFWGILKSSTFPKWPQKWLNIWNWLSHTWFIHSFWNSVNKVSWKVFTVTSKGTVECYKISHGETFDIHWWAPVNIKRFPHTGWPATVKWVYKWNHGYVSWCGNTVHTHVWTPVPT